MLNLSTICTAVEGVINSVRLPAPAIPAALLVCGALNRPGLSAKLIASKIIKRQVEAGAPFGPADDGTQNVMEAMEVIRIEELINAIKFDAKVEVGIPPGSINVTGTVITPTGGGTCTAFNPGYAKGVGIVS